MVRPHRRPGAERAIPTTRRHAREWAVQLLFALDAAVRGDTPSAASLDLPIVFEDFWEEQYRLRLEEQGLSDDETAAALLEDGWRDLVATRATRAFCEAIVEGVFLHLAEIDSAIERSSDHWALDRMGGVERSVLRMGAWELLFRSGEVPRAVAINEAVDVCKYFGMRESARFVNGLLDRIADLAGVPRRPGSDASAPPAPDGSAPAGPGAPDDHATETWTPGD